MRFWISPLASVGFDLVSVYFCRRRSPPEPAVVIAPPADPVDRIFGDFIRLDSDERARLLWRILLCNG